MVVSCTGGERGDVLNPKLAVRGLDIPALRSPRWPGPQRFSASRTPGSGFRTPGYHEGDPDTWELPAGSFGALDPDEEIEALVKVVRQFRPHVMTTYDENGGYPHPDHIRCHVVSMAAFEAAGDPEAYPDAGEPWQPLKLYYNVGFSRERILAINEAVKERTGEGPFDEWIKRFADNPRPDPASASPPGSRSPTSSPPRDAALKAHETQIDPDAHWFAVPHDLEAADLGHRRLRAGQVAGRHGAAGGRPVRRGPRAGRVDDALMCGRSSRARLADGRQPTDVDPDHRARPGVGRGGTDRAAGHPADVHRACSSWSVDGNRNLKKVPDSFDRTGPGRSERSAPSAGAD